MGQQIDDFERLRSEWHALMAGASLDNAAVRRWLVELDNLNALEESLISMGRWVSGPSDLMAVLEIERDEVKHCRVLAWLLNPNGAHGLGAGFLHGFLRDIAALSGALDILQGALTGVTVVKEEAKG